MPTARLAPFLVSQVAGSAAGFLILCRLLPDSLSASPLIILLLAVLALASFALGWTRLQGELVDRLDASLLTLSGAALGTMALATGYVLAGYATIPVDIVSFAESSFVNDIIKWRTGTPLFTPGPDNSAYPYMPGTQLLTYGLASLLGDPTSISLMRQIALGYVVLAALVATYATDRLFLLALPGSARGLRPLWWWILACVAWLAATDPRFNMFVHSLHNDGLALLVAVAAFAAAASHLHRPRAATWAAMLILPVAGYLVKQSLLIWSPLLAVLLLVAGQVAWRKVLLLTLTAFALAGAATWYGYRQWGGDDFLFWVFSSLGSKQISPARSVQHLLLAGGYVVGLLAWVRVILSRGTPRPALALLLASAGLLLVEAYTSGIGFTPNHLGPGVVLAAMWGMLALAAAWPAAPWGSGGRLVRFAQTATLAALPIFFLGGLGLFREPRNPVPPDLARYVAAIDAEFAGQPADLVLLDMGSWPYLRDGVVMKDRGDPVALHAGANQASVSREMIAETIARIRARTYSRILARNIEGALTPYDFQHRGTGVREVILEEYRIVRRIPAVRDVKEWWPRYLLGEVAVLEPRQPGRAP